jgi:tetratricopeptide (TPR) repeat protein
VRYHSAKRVIEEMKAILHGFPTITDISIWDDLFAADRTRLRRVAEIFESSGLRRNLRLGSSVRASLVDDELCGLLHRLNYTTIGFGAESGSDPILKKLKDPHCSVAGNQHELDTASRNGLTCACAFVLGHYDETEEDLLKTYEFILDNYGAGKLAKHEITILTPMPGTPLWRWAEEQGLINVASFRWSSLRYLALYSNNLKEIKDWIALREQNGSMYLNERNVPREHLYQIIQYYEEKIRRRDFTRARPRRDEAIIDAYFLHRRDEIISAVPPSAVSILDIGCGGGMLGKALKELRKDRRVVGIELNADAAAYARKYLDSVYQSDVESFDPPFSKAEFDCIVFADILEHLKNPWFLVKHYTHFLKPGGKVVASIPNVRYLGILRDLIQHGTWEYQNEGILDRTHLRFFTRKDFENLLRDADIQVESMRYLPGERDVQEVKIKGTEHSLSYGTLSIDHVTHGQLEELQAYQMVFVGTYVPTTCLEAAPSISMEEVSLLDTPALTETIEEAYAGIREIFLVKGKWEDAIYALERLLEACPDHAPAHNDLGRLFYRKGEKEKALFHLEKAAFLNPENVAFQKDLADFCYVELRQVDEAVSRYRKILSLRPDATEILLLLGNIHVEQKMFDEAQGFFHKALEIDPGNPCAGKMLNALNGREEKRRRICEKTYQEARLLIESGDIDAAITTLTELTQVFPEYSLAYNDLGFLYYQKGEKEKALVHYERAVSLGPENITALKNLADFYCAEAGRTEDALKIYNRILVSYPNDVETLLALGHICITLNRLDDARPFYDRVLEIDPSNSQASMNRKALSRYSTERSFPLSPIRVSFDLHPLKSLDEFRQYALSMADQYQARRKLEQRLVAQAIPYPIMPGEEDSAKAISFTVPGFCIACNTEVEFIADYHYAIVSASEGTITPNWRERLLCPKCGLNNRQRLSIHILKEILGPRVESAIYATEQDTPVYHWLKKHFPWTIGSEFFGARIPLGSEDRNGIRNEDLTALTLPDLALDFVLCFDVLEHIPDYLKALEEVHRVLKPGGSLLFSLPFNPQAAENVKRAISNPDGTTEHLLPAQYHGDPVNGECLCYHTFGWKLLEQLRDIGFEDAKAYFCWSDKLGYLGEDQIIFVAVKSSRVLNRLQGTNQNISCLGMNGQHPVS